MLGSSSPEQLHGKLSWILVRRKLLRLAWMLWDPVPGSKPLFLLFLLSDACECESACAEPSKHQCCAVVADSICGKVHGAPARFGEPPLLCAAQPSTASGGLGLSHAWGLLGL